jgi:hypothetical protein
MQVDSDKDVENRLAREETGSLNAAGYAYILGDAALFASGMIAGRSKEALSGATYASGGLILARYGKEPAERRLERLNGKLREYFEREGVTIPQGELTHTARTSIVSRIEDFLYTYPSEVLNSVYAIGGFSLLRSGLQHQKTWDAASGALVTAGALAGLLIQEKKPDPNDRPTTPIGKAVEWVQEKPLRLSGALYMLNNVTLTASAMQEMHSNPAQKSYLFKFLTAASFIVANSFLSVSSKDSDKDANSQEQKDFMTVLARRAASVIAAQPKALQEEVITQTAGYLSAQPELNLSANQIADALRGQIAALHPPQSRGL